MNVSVPVPFSLGIDPCLSRKLSKYTNYLPVKESSTRQLAKPINFNVLQSGFYRRDQIQRRVLIGVIS